MKQKINPYLNVNRIEFIVTYRCTGRCRHCQMGDDINRSDMPAHMTPDRASEAVREFAKLFPLTSVMTFGGEPLLFPDVTCAIHSAATDAGVATRQIITNGWFSSEEDKIARIARRLKDAGVNNLLLSVDALHQETVPVEPVYALARAVAAEGIPNAYIYPAWVQGERAVNPINEATRGILARFADTGLPIRGNTVYPSGNAAVYLAEYFGAPAPDLDAACGAAPYTDPLTDVHSLSVEPNGDVAICGFCIGNLYEETAEAIAARYDPLANEVMRAVSTGGGAALLELAKEKGIEADCGGYYSVCELCHALARAMR